MSTLFRVNSKIILNGSEQEGSGNNSQNAVVKRTLQIYKNRFGAIKHFLGLYA